MIDSNIRSGDAIVDVYIAQLEKELSSYTTSNTKRLIRSIDGMAKKISDDLDLLSKDEKNPDGTEVELSNKFVDTFLKMVEKADKIKAFSEIADNMYGVKEELTIDEDGKPEKKVATKGNMFEVIQERVKSKG